MFLGSLDYRIRGMVLITDPNLIVEIVAKVFAPNDADVVEFKSLNVVDASDLIDTARVRRPEGSGRNSRGQAPISRLSVPRPPVIADDHIIGERAVVARL